MGSDDDEATSNEEEDDLLEEPAPAPEPPEIRRPSKGPRGSIRIDDIPSLPPVPEAVTPDNSARLEESGLTAAALASITEAHVNASRLVHRRRSVSKEIQDSIQIKRKSTIQSMISVDDAEMKQAQEIEKYELPQDFFYEGDDPQLQPQLGDNEIPKTGLKPVKFVGFDFTRYYNLTWTSEKEFAYVCGHVLVFQTIGDPIRKRYLHARDDGGIGDIAMSQDGRYLAVAEKSTTGQPNIYIYFYKDFKLFRILRRGTTRGYASVQFSPHKKGMHLAALGQAPDYLLSVWDWRNERLLLKCKAYGQDVFSARWGQFPGMLTTIGTGHIRFWKMAATFTGLKLQGDIGKFGATELSDIVGFVELPDGKIVTGTEYGRILLWEGVFVKVELMRGTAKNPLKIEGLPHEGSVDVVMLDQESKCVVTGGSDGYLRWWPLAEIDVAEADYDNGILEYGISVQSEVRIPSNVDGGLGPAHIQHVARSHDDATWLIQDARNGVIWAYDKDARETVLEICSHSGPVTGTLLMDQFPGLAISCGADGTIRGINLNPSLGTELNVFTEPQRLGAGICCLAAAPEAIDPEQRTFCCCYTDGTLRVFTACRDSIVLVQAQKPHTCAVEQVGYNSDGTLLFSRGMDNTIFFFEVRGLQEHLSPMGFLQIHCKVNHASWHKSGRLLLALEDGSIMELSQPLLDLIDNSESYQTQLDYRAVVPEVPDVESEDEEEEGGEGEHAAEGEEGAPAEPEYDEDGKKKETKEERRERRKREKQAAKEVKMLEDEENEKQAVVSEITRAIYMPKEWASDEQDDVVLFVGTGIYAGSIWSIPMGSVEVQRCEDVTLGEHTPSLMMAALRTKIPEVKVTYMTISPKERFIFLGLQDGNVWIIPFANMDAHSIFNVADSTTGVIKSISCDQKEEFMLVGSADGTCTSVEFNGDGIIEAAKQLTNKDHYDAKKVAKQLKERMPNVSYTDASVWDLPFVETSGIHPGRDIIDPKQYSVQEAKLKAEEDNARAAAEQRKRRVYEKVAEIRRELEELQARNNQMPCNALTTEEITVDVEHIAHLHEHAAVQLEEVNKELAWHVEYHEKSLQRLKDYYLGRLDYERIEVLAFNAPHRVATFRCAAMSKELCANLAQLHELIFSADRQVDENEDDEDVADGIMLGVSMKSGIAGRRNTEKGGIEFFAGGGRDGEGEMRMSGTELRELRRQQRQSRRQQLADLEKAKPSETYEDPQDLEALAHAEATLGNYMLKTSDSYQVPENQRMNAEKKRRQMFLLEESMHAIKSEFNQRVLALRDFRQQVKAEVGRDLAALNEIDQQLNTSTPWVVGLLDDPLGAPPEFPERRFEMTESQLKEYIISIGGNAAVVKNEELKKNGKDDSGEDDRSPSKAATGPVVGRAALAARRIGRLTMRAQMLKESNGPLSKSIHEEALSRLWHDKAQLEDHIRQVIDTFNSAVASIEKEKCKLESDLKNADMKLLVLFEELLTLNELEERDEALLRKATKCRQDKTHIMHQIKECQDQLGEKKVEIEQWHNEEQSLQAEFTELVGETSPFLGALLKIYKKKVKRRNRKKAGEEEEMSGDEDDDEEDSDIESDEEDEDMEEDVGPPPGCDVQVYESVVDLREKRLDMEDALQEIQRAVEELKKTHKKLLDDERRIDKEQKGTDQEIQQFQTDKQRKLNQIPIVFSLRLSQVQCLEQRPGGREDSSRLPPQLDNQVVFTTEGLHRLMHRITELHQENKQVKQKYFQLKRDFRSRKKEKNQAINHIESLREKFQDIQMLKFGQIVDLDLIERNAPSKYVQELQERVLEAEREHRRKLAEWEKRIERQKKELTKITAENTSLMDQIVSMGYSQMQLDAALNARIANVTVNDTEPLTEARELEREKLKDLLALQNKEIVTLQAEINLFRKKGGHIYTTVTAGRT